MLKNVLLIINPAAGQDFPILHFLHKNVDSNKTQLDIKVTTKKGDVQKFIDETNLPFYDAVAVYGGDGTVNEAVDALYNKNKPLIILPGGTANVLAKELNIPIPITEAIQAINGNSTSNLIDVGLVNKKPFTLRVSTGPLADMILKTDNTLKQQVGQLAYGVTIIQALQNASQVNYSLTVDGKHFIEKGISIIVANSGNLGFQGVSFLPSIQINDGLLDIFILKQSSIGYITSILKEAVMSNSDAPIDHYQGKKIEIVMEPNQSTISDDTEIPANTLSIEILPKILPVLIPVQ